MTLMINDLEQDEKLDREAMKSIAGGGLFRAKQYDALAAAQHAMIDSTKGNYEVGKEIQRRSWSIWSNHHRRQSSVVRKFTY